ncbi:MAG: LOG family protein [Phycisphaeraceae bacterium]|nr:LOG family protein [Phycisphaeraceae bacterium]
MPQDITTDTLDDLVTRSGGDPGTLSGKIARELMHTALKLLDDQADEGEMKLISRSLKELRYALKVFRPYRDVPKISVFGSARTPPQHPHYKAAEQFSRLMAQAGWMVITGAGDGIMRAGHGGAGPEKSFGVAIRLPFETNANEFILGDPKLVIFRYFFTRKLVFMWMSHAVALFPGGFGTHDEAFEALTLIQTGKAPLVPIVAVDAPGSNKTPAPASLVGEACFSTPGASTQTGDYWLQWKHYIETQMLAAGLISPDDMNLFMVTDDPRKAVDEVLNFYRNYHSQRFVYDKLVLRLRRPLTDKQLDALNDEFVSLIKEGRMQQGGPLEQESGEYPNLPRLHFEHTRRDYGRLRLLINRINQFDQKNA